MRQQSACRETLLVDCAAKPLTGGASARFRLLSVAFPPAPSLDARGPPNQIPHGARVPQSRQFATSSDYSGICLTALFKGGHNEHGC